MMPYDTAHFMPRKNSDRPRVVPPGSTNLAFIGQFVEIPDECSFLVEASIRAAMIGIYTLLDVQREVPPIYRSPGAAFSFMRE
jgi:oleate hydratase